MTIVFSRSHTYTSAKTIRVRVTFSMVNLVFPPLPAILPIALDRWSPFKGLTKWEKQDLRKEAIPALPTSIGSLIINQISLLKDTKHAFFKKLLRIWLNWCHWKAESHAEYKVSSTKVPSRSSYKKTTRHSPSVISKDSRKRSSSLIRASASYNTEIHTVKCFQLITCVSECVLS